MEAANIRKLSRGGAWNMPVMITGLAVGAHRFKILDKTL
jgi:hypothetical protein